MSRRHDDSAHSVYMLDTMNNVLGILILVLILTQVMDIATQGPKDTTPRSVPELEKELAALLQESGLTLEQLDVEPASRTDAGSPVAASTASTAAREQALDRYASARQERDALRRTLLRLTGDTNDAATITAPRGLPATVSWTPERTVTFWCRGGRLQRIDLNPAYDTFLAALNRVANAAAASNQPIAFETLARQLNTQDLGDRGLALACSALPDGLLLSTRPRTMDTWLPVTAIAGPQSPLATTLSEAAPTRTLLTFHVWADSFDVYLAAVKLAKAHGFRTRWIVHPLGEEFSERWSPAVEGQAPPSRAVQVDP